MNPFEIVQAEISDLASIVSMLADDDLGTTREKYSLPVSEDYISAFNKISKDKNAHLIVVKQSTQTIAVAQLNMITYLTYQGGMRAQIEGVRVHKLYQGQGIGKMLFQYLIQLAKDEGAHMIQLTTNKKRPDAVSFYKRLGFDNTHEGFKLEI